MIFKGNACGGLPFPYWFADDRPDGKKKAYVRLTADHDALDVANKVGPSTCSILTGPRATRTDPISYPDSVDRIHLNDSRLVRFYEGEWRVGELVPEPLNAR